jgi:hypothetical protein
MARAQAKSVSRHFHPFHLIPVVMATAALPSHIIGKMTKQGGLCVRVVVFKFPSRLPQIRGENSIVARSIWLRLLHEVATASFGGKHQIGDVESLPPFGMWREEAHATTSMTRRAEMRTLSRRFLNRRNCSSQDWS